MKVKVLFLALLMPLAMMSCGQGEKAEAGNKQGVINIAMAANGDSVQMNVDRINTGSALTDSLIAEYINEQLGGDYTGSTADFEKMLRYYATSRLDTMKANRKEMGDLESAPWIDILECKKVLDTDKVVSYEITHYIYEGGAHGMELISGATFRKSDGRRLGSEILKNIRDERWMTVYKTGLKKYFNVGTDKDLEESLFPSNAWIPQPETEPYFTKDGLKFIYQQYEIAAYAAGHPTVTVSYKDLKPYLMKAYQQLFY